MLVPSVGTPCWPERLCRLVAIEGAGGWEPDALRRLAALAVRDVSDAGLLRDHLRLSNEERDRLFGIAQALTFMRGLDWRSPEVGGVLRLLHAYGRCVALDVLLLSHAESHAQPADDEWQAAARRAATAPMPVLPVSGADLLDRGIKAGPLVGAVLKDVQARWIRAGFASDPTTLHRLLDEAIAAVIPERSTE